MRTASVLLGLLLALPAAADVTIVYQVQHSQTGMGAKQSQGTDTTYIKADRYASVNHQGTSSIIRLDKQLMWTVNTKEQSYTERTFDEIKKQMEQAREQMKKTAAQYEAMLNNPNMPEATKQQMRKMLAQMKEQKYEVEKKGTAKVADYECTHYVVSNNGQKMYDVWACDSIKGAEAYGKSMSKVMGGGAMDPVFKQIKGVWLKYEMETKNQYMQIKQSSVATKVSTDSVDDKQFEIPQGYSKK